MYTISVWAKQHAYFARLLIAIATPATFLLAFYTGRMLFNRGVILPEQPLYLLAFLFLVTGILLYPATGLSKVKSYARQKACDILLTVSAIIVITAGANNLDVTGHAVHMACASVVVPAPTAKEILESGKTRKELTWKEKRILKKEFRNQLKKYVAAKISNDKAGAQEAAKIILAIILLVGLTILLAALVCDLSCSGSETAALLIGVLGIIGLVWGFIALVKAIHEKTKKERAKKKE